MEIAAHPLQMREVSKEACMKKLILLVSFIMVTGVYSQTSNTNTTNPGTGFGGALGGSPTQASPAATSGLPFYPSSPTPIPRNDTPASQRMEAGPSSTYSGGAMGGAAPSGSPTGTTNVNGNVPSTQPNLPGNSINSGTGLGTGMGPGSSEPDSSMNQ